MSFRSSFMGFGSTLTHAEDPIRPSPEGNLRIPFLERIEWARADIFDMNHDFCRDRDIQLKAFSGKHRNRELCQGDLIGSGNVMRAIFIDKMIELQKREKLRRTKTQGWIRREIKLVRI